VSNINLQKITNLSFPDLPKVEDTIATDQIVDRLSASIKYSWPKLVRAVARALKLYMDGFLPLLKSKMYNDAQTIELIKQVNNEFRLDRKDYVRAELFIIRKAQREAMPELYEKFNRGKPIQDDEML
jgi:hypothetical protein